MILDLNPPATLLVESPLPLCGIPPSGGLAFRFSLTRRLDQNCQAEVLRLLRSLHLDGAVPARRSPVPSIGIVWVESSLQRKPRRSSPRPRAPVKGRGRRPGVTAVGGWLRSRSAACGRCSEAEQGQRSAFCKRATSRAAKAGHRNPDWVKIIPQIERQSLRHRIRRAAQQFYRSLRSPQDVSRLRTAGAGLGSEQRFKGR